MTNEEYIKACQDVFDKYGKAEYEMNKPTNEAARQLQTLRIAKAAEGRRQARLDRLSELEKAVKGEREKKLVKQLPTVAINLEEVDLNAFTAKERDLLIAWFEDQTQTPKTLAHRFNWSYQAVAGFLNDPRVKVLDAKYFNMTLEREAKTSILKLLRSQDARVSLAAAEVAGLWKKDVSEEKETLIDPRADKINKLVGDWLAGSEAELVIRRVDIES